MNKENLFYVIISILIIVVTTICIYLFGKIISLIKEGIEYNVTNVDYRIESLEPLVTGLIYEPRYCSKNRYEYCIDDYYNKCDLLYRSGIDIICDMNGKQYTVDVFWCNLKTECFGVPTNL